MSEKSWDDEDYEVPAPISSIKKPTDDRWEGEDEERVKDNWDDEEDEEHKPVQQTSAPVAKKKTKKQIIAEKQAAKEAALAAKRAEIEKLNAAMTPEEKVAEKLRLQKIQEESDLQFAVDMMGIKDMPAPVAEITSLADVDISTESGLNALGDAVIKKIRATDRLEKRTFYSGFLESFCKDLCQNVELDELKKVTASLNALYNDKVKASKPIKGKKKGANKGKILLDKEVDITENDRFIDDFDDFI